MLEAQGHTREEIARVVNRSVRQVSDWRNLPAYQKRTSELQEAGAGAYDSFVQRARSVLLSGVEASVRTLKGALEATVADTGYPDWETRLNAATIILAHAQRAGLEVRSEKGDGEKLTAGAVVIVRDERPPDIVVQG